MSAIDLIAFVTQVVYALIFVLVLWRTIRYPTPAHADMSLFFGAISFVALGSLAGPRLGSPAWLAVAQVILLMALPYLLLRLVADFSAVRTALMRLVELGLVASIAAAVVFGQKIPTAVALAMVAYFVVVLAYCGVMFFRAARRAPGVTRRRLESAAAGSVLLGAVLFVAGIGTVAPADAAPALGAVTQLLGLGSAIAYYMGFSPPAALRRAWQAPELHSFLTRAAQIPRLPTTLDVVRELERGAAGAVGAFATIGLWDDDLRVLRFLRAAPSEEIVEVRPGELAGGRAFAVQRALFTANAVRDHPEGAAQYRASGVGAAIAAPITSGERRIGVLCTYAEKPPLFAASDVEIVQLLADQAATILEARALIDHAALVQAREQAARLKEDFVSAAAHDLRTPLTTVVAQSQFLERRALRDPSAPTDIRGVQRVAREAERLAALVTDLLDVARLEQRRLLGEREPVDLGGIVAAVTARYDGTAHPITVDVRSPVVGSYDARRIEQLVANLVENAAKYSPRSSPVTVEVWQEGDQARIVVRDQGIGIPVADLPHIFDRFGRGSNVDDRRSPGMGLGLYICRGIAEEHGGRIWAESEVGKGSTFHVALPIRADGRLN